MGGNLCWRYLLTHASVRQPFRVAKNLKIIRLIILITKCIYSIFSDLEFFLFQFEKFLAELISANLCLTGWGFCALTPHTYVIYKVRGGAWPPTAPKTPELETTSQIATDLLTLKITFTEPLFLSLVLILEKYFVKYWNYVTWGIMRAR